MSNIPDSVEFSRSGNSVFENVYVYETLYVSKIVFDGDVDLDKLNVNKRLNVGADGINLNVDTTTGSVGINTTDPKGALQVSGRIGINSDYVDPTGIRQLEIGDSLKIGRFIYDSNNNPGQPTSVLSMDSGGVTWIQLSSQVREGILLYDEGETVGNGVSFTSINFVQKNSGGLGTDTLGPTSSGTVGYATIFTNDFWGFNEAEVDGTKTDISIYRKSKVGIQNETPSSTLDVTGTVRVSAAVTFSDALHVLGITSTQNSIVVGISTTKDFTVTGLATVNNLTVTGITTLGVTSATQVNVGVLTVRDKIDVLGITSTHDFEVVGASTVSTLKVKSTLELDDKLKDVNDNFGNTVSSTLYTPQSPVTYTPADGNLTLTINNHGFSNGDLIRIADNSLTFKCDKDSNATEHTYPRLSDPASGKWLSVTVSDVNTISVNVGKSGSDDQYTHTFVSASNNCIIHSSGTTPKEDYRLASVGAGVTWRPSGVQTKKTIWVSTSGNDNNSGLLEGDAKATIGGAAAIAQQNDTIIVRPGVYDENNPVGLRTDVSITGQDLRLVTVRPKNLERDIFHVRRGCLVENLNFSCNNVSVANTGGAAVAFPPTQDDITAGNEHLAVSGFIQAGPTDEGDTGRWRSPYVRNCTNFMTKSIGMKINGNYATVRDLANNPGNNIKSMVCDSFTQYNEAGIGVSITNSGYAQLVSIFTINCDIAIYSDTGGQCDLTNSNSSFGNFGLVADGLGPIEFTGFTSSFNLSNADTIVAYGITDSSNSVRRPFDGQALWFKIDLDNYPESQPFSSAYTNGIITAPLEQLDSITINGNGGSGFSQASPPNIIIRDNDGVVIPKGPQGIVAEASANVSAAGTITSIDIINSGRNYLSTQNIVVDIDGNTSLATANMSSIYFTVLDATEPVADGAGITSTTITTNEFIPYQIFNDDPIELRRISRILTSSHSFEYVGSGTSINSSLPFQGGNSPIKENEVVARNGAQIPFTSTDQKGNFDIGDGIQVDQTTSTIRGRDFSRAIQAEVTPLILALR
jgi:hypothetical protein